MTETQNWVLIGGFFGIQTLFLTVLTLWVRAEMARVITRMDAAEERIVQRIEALSSLIDVKLQALVDRIDRVDRDVRTTIPQQQQGPR